jgi:hypothetical protein
MQGRGRWDVQSLFLLESPRIFKPYCALFRAESRVVPNSPSRKLTSKGKWLKTLKARHIIERASKCLVLK